MEQDRCLGWFERVLAGYDLLTDVCVSEWSITSGHIDVPSLNKAVLSTVNRHPNLRVNIDKSQEPWKFVPADDFTQCFQVIRTESPESWKTVVKNVSMEKFNPGSRKPFLKVSLILPSVDEADETRGQTFHLAACFHHAIGDGRSGMFITKDIMRYYSDFINGRMKSPDEVVSLCPVDDVIRLAFPNGLSQGDKLVKKKQGEAFAHYRRTWKPVLPILPLNSSCTDSFLCQNGSDENMQMLRKKCHDEKVTVGSVLMAATGFSLAKRSSEQEAFEPMFDIDVDLRTRFAESMANDHVALLIGLIVLKGMFINSESKFWETAKTIKSKLDEYISDHQPFLFHLVGSEFDLKDPVFVENVKNNHGSVADMNVSNIGPWQFEKNFENCSLENMYTVGSGWAPGQISGFFIHSVTHLCYSFSYLEVTGLESECLNQAKGLFKDMIYLTENAHTFDNSYSFADFVKS